MKLRPCRSSVFSSPECVVPAERVITASRRLLSVARPAIALIFTLCVSSCVAAGQVSFFQPPAAPCAEGALTGDFNGDGKADVICAAGYVELGNGNGTFTQVSQLTVTGTPIAAADFNGDGKLDLLVSGSGTSLSILLGKGDGTFTVSTTVNPGIAFQTTAVGDLRGDGKVDVIGLASEEGLFVFLGNGDGTLQQYVDYDSGLSLVTGGLVIGDFNGDHKLDVAISGSGSDAVAVLLGNGDGTLQPPLYSAGPPEVPVAAAAFGPGSNLDLIVTSGVGGSAFILLGNGDGTFQGAQPVESPAAYSIAVGDLNGDGKLDLALNLTAAIETLLGTGDGTFTPGGTYHQLGAQSSQGRTAVLLSDFNSDGKLDAISGGTLFFGNDDGSLQGSAEVLSPDAQEFLASAAGDFNGDGKPDIVALSGGGNLYILLNQGTGQFSVAYSYALQAGGGLAPPVILIGDLNNDGKLDLVIPGVNEDLYVLLGKGDGSFTVTTVYYPPSPALSPILADFNGDHNLDIAVVQYFTSSLLLFLGNGDGTFQSPVSYFAGEGPIALVAGDFNNDGKADISVLGYAGLGILLGNGDGTFQGVTYMNSGITADAYLGSLFAGDLDGGNTLDLLAETNAGEQVFLGKGDATFTALSPVTNLNANVLADLNLDGKLDVAGGGTVELGNGDGTFGSPITLIPSNSCCQGSIQTVADFNSDGLPDLAADTTLGVTVFLNNTSPGFIIAPPSGSPTSATVSAGNSATLNLNVAPVGSFSGTVNLTCSVSPVVSAGPTCMVPATAKVTPGTSTSFTVTVNTTAGSAAGTVASDGLRLGPTPLIWAPALFALAIFLSHAPRVFPAFASTVALFTLLSFAGCGGGGPAASSSLGTPAKTYTATVTGTSGSATSKSTLTVVVQ